MIAERIVYKLVELHSKKNKSTANEATENNPISSLEVIGENGIEEQLISHRINVGQEYKTSGDGQKFTNRRRSSNPSEEEKHL